MKLNFNEVRVGQRIHVHYGEGKDNFSGTVNHIVPGIFLSVVRDDGKLGKGQDRAWRVNWSTGTHKTFYLELIQDVAEATAKTVIPYQQIVSKLAISAEDVRSRVIHFVDVQGNVIHVADVSGTKITLQEGDVLMRLRTALINKQSTKDDLLKVMIALGDHALDEIFKAILEDYTYMRIFTLAQGAAIQERVSQYAMTTQCTILDTLGEKHLVSEVFNGTVLRFSALDYNRFFGIENARLEQAPRRIKINTGGATLS